MTERESTHELHFPIGVLAPVARFGRHEDNERVAADLSSSSMQFGRQNMAICAESGLIAVANGRVVELYRGDAITARGPQTQDHNNQPTQPLSLQPHLPFAGRIVLSDLIYGLEDSPTYATSVYFPAADVLFVASTTVQDAHSSQSTKSPSISTRLSGFRLYSRRVGARIRKTTSSREEEPFTIFLLFSDAFAGVAPITTMEPVPRSSFRRPDRGAMVLLFDQDREAPVSASSFGVFHWSERYSDRELAVSTPLQAMASALTAIAVSEDAQWIAVGDASGGVSVLDFRRFVWDPEMDRELPVGIQGGRRLPLGLRFRMGHTMPHAATAATRHPLDDVRITCLSRVGTANAFASSLRWWTASQDGASSRTARRYLLAGHQDGALTVMVLVRGKDDHSPLFTLKTTEIYPALRALKNDAMVFISEPKRDLTSNAYSFSVICTSSWRRWTINQTGHEDDGKRRLVWPTLSDSLGLPTHQFQRQELYGLVMLCGSDRIAVRLGDAIATRHHSSRHLEWLLLLGRDGIRTLAQDLKVEDAVTAQDLHENQDLAAQDVDLDVHDEDEEAWSQRQSVDTSVSAGRHLLKPQSQSTKAADSANSHDNQPHETTRSVDTPVVTQSDSIDEERPAWFGEKLWDEATDTTTTPANPYNLPPMASRSHQSAVAPQLEDPPRPLTKDQYTKRLAVMARRVETMSSNLHSLRRSFQLFTDDVKDHMAFMSLQLEQLQERVENGRNSA